MTSNHQWNITFNISTDREALYMQTFSFNLLPKIEPFFKRLTITFQQLLPYAKGALSFNTIKKLPQNKKLTDSSGFMRATNSLLLLPPRAGVFLRLPDSGLDLWLFVQQKWHWATSGLRLGEAWQLPLPPFWRVLLPCCKKVQTDTCMRKACVEENPAQLTRSGRVPAMWVSHLGNRPCSPNWAATADTTQASDEPCIKPWPNPKTVCRKISALMPLHLGVVCYAATGNRNKTWYQEWGSAETQTWSMYWLRVLTAGRSWKNLDKIITNGWKREKESLVAEEGNRSHILAST